MIILLFPNLICEAAEDDLGEGKGQLPAAVYKSRLGHVRADGDSYGAREPVDDRVGDGLGGAGEVEGTRLLKVLLVASHRVHLGAQRRLFEAITGPRSQNLLNPLPHLL